MITNERQLQVARADIERFEAALSVGMIEAGLDPTILKAQREALKAQVSMLRNDVASYLELRSGAVRSFSIDSLSDLPRALISCRIATGMTQKQLADRLALKEQQIQRYETQLYQGASFSRIADVADALGVQIPAKLHLAGADSTDAILKRAALAGVDPNFVKRRIAPGSNTRTLADRLSYVFDWDPNLIASGVALELPQVAGARARFKMPRNRNARNVAAYSAYAYRLAQLCADAMPVREQPLVPIDANGMINLVNRRGDVRFETVLETAWDLGIIVVPLTDGGQFHGACWRINSTNVIVLKQGDRSAARWLIDLLHEMFHAGRFPDKTFHEVIEEPETSDYRRNDPEEQQATWFASLVSTRGLAEQLFCLLLGTRPMATSVC